MTIINKNPAKGWSAFSGKRKVIIRTLGGVFVLLSIFSFVTFASASEITPENIVNIVNRERQTRGITPLATNNQLQTAARNKSTDMIVRNYFNHYAHGVTPWQFIRNQNYEYSIAGENLAMGFSSAESVVNAWMNSPSHRANILNPEFQDIGVGIVKGAYNDNGNIVETTMTTEILAKPKSKINQIFDRVIAAFSKLF